MSLTDAVREHVKAGFAGLYVKTYEPDDAEQEIGALCMAQGWAFHHWDIDSGLGDDPGTKDPVACMQAVRVLADGTPTLIMLRYYNKVLGNVEVISATENAIREGKHRGLHLVIVAPEVSLPIELSRSFTVLNHDLPDRATLLEIAQGIGTEPGELPDGSKLETLIDASQGLTRIEAENAFSLSLIRHQSIKADEVFNLKAQALTKTGYLKLCTSKRRFSDLGGLANIKKFCLDILAPNPDRIGNPQGILALGPPGTGKTAFAEALGNEVGLPTVILDIGALKGSLVGESEERTRHAINTINALGNCIVFIDECEKALAGAGGTGNLDSGVSAGIFGTFLTWLSDPDRKAFIVATSNNIQAIPSAFTRSGRFDAVFCWDLPGREQKDKIWDIYIKKYRIDPAQDRPEDMNWTGSDIEACCSKANSLRATLLDASKYVVPVAKRASQDIEAIRSYCDGTTISADYPDYYRRNPAQTMPAITSKPARTIDRSK